MAHSIKPRIMYIENKGGTFVEHSLGNTTWKESTSGNLTGAARIGRVTFSRTGDTLYYQGKAFQSLKGSGFKANYIETETGEHYWISGPKKNGHGALYATNITAEIDEEVREEYWIEIRRKPELKHQKHT